MASPRPSIALPNRVRAALPAVLGPRPPSGGFPAGSGGVPASGICPFCPCYVAAPILALCEPSSCTSCGHHAPPGFILQNLQRHRRSSCNVLEIGLLRQGPYPPQVVGARAKYLPISFCVGSHSHRESTALDWRTCPPCSSRSRAGHPPGH
jgi:hypothetical protein